MFGKGQHSVEREAVKREKERRDELESLAEEARKDVLKVSISDADLQTINKDIAAIRSSG
jgi:hypothetical protein